MMQNIDTVEQCGAVVRAAENVQELSGEYDFFGFISHWLVSPPMQTDSSKQAMKQIICGLLAPRFYPGGFDFVVENREDLLRTIQDSRVSSAINYVNRIHDAGLSDEDHQAATAQLLKIIYSVDEDLLSADEQRIARSSKTGPSPLDTAPATSGLAELTSAGKLLLEQQLANARTPE